MSFRLSFLVDLGKIYLSVCEYANYFSNPRANIVVILSTQRQFKNAISEQLARSAKIGSNVRNFLLNVSGKLERLGNYFDNFRASSIDDKAKRELVFS